MYIHVHHCMITVAAEGRQESVSTGRAPTIVFCWKFVRAGVYYLLEVCTGGGLLFAGSGRSYMYMYVSPKDL